MQTASCAKPASYLLPRICETVPLRLSCKTAPLCLSCPLPGDVSFVSGALNAPAQLQALTLCPTKAGYGCKLTAQLHLPVCLHFACGCETIFRTGCIQLSIQALLRTPSSAALQYIPQAELCLRNVFMQDNSFCAEFDLGLCLYAVQMQPVQLCIPCPESKPDCTPFFNLPLYPELPHR